MLEDLGLSGSGKSAAVAGDRGLSSQSIGYVTTQKCAEVIRRAVP